MFSAFVLIYIYIYIFIYNMNTYMLHIIVFVDFFLEKKNFKNFKIKTIIRIIKISHMEEEEYIHIICVLIMDI